MGTYVGLELGLGWVGGITDGKVKLEVWGGWAVFENGNRISYGSKNRSGGPLSPRAATTLNRSNDPEGATRWVRSLLVIVAAQNGQQACPC